MVALVNTQVRGYKKLRKQFPLFSTFWYSKTKENNLIRTRKYLDNAVGGMAKWLGGVQIAPAQQQVSDP
jgi:hypothetical protein